MSGNYLAVDTEALAQAAPEVERLASRVHALTSQLSASLSSLGTCWGNDRTGAEFAKQYVNAKDQQAQALSSASKVLDSMSDGISTMAKGFHKTEEDNASAAADLHKQ